MVTFNYKLKCGIVKFQGGIAMILTITVESRDRGKNFQNSQWYFADRSFRDKPDLLLLFVSFVAWQRARRLLATFPMTPDRNLRDIKKVSTQNPLQNKSLIDNFKLQNLDRTRSIYEWTVRFYFAPRGTPPETFRILREGCVKIRLPTQ